MQWGTLIGSYACHVSTKWVWIGVSFATEHKATINELNYGKYIVEEIMSTSELLEIFIAHVFKVWQEFLLSERK